MVPAMLASVILVLLTILIHYEALRITAGYLPRMTFVRPRGRIVFVILAIFAAHTAEVYLYAGGYWAMTLADPAGDGARLAQVNGETINDLFNYVYFSSITFTTTGFGDIIPHGALRLIAGVEGLNGLLMIGWSASFTYLCMQELWPLHGRRRPHHGQAS
jgi:hypothetical protein